MEVRSCVRSCVWRCREEEKEMERWKWRSLLGILLSEFLLSISKYSPIKFCWFPPHYASFWQTLQRRGLRVLLSTGYVDRLSSHARKNSLISNMAFAVIAMLFTKPLPEYRLLFIVTSCHLAEPSVCHHNERSVPASAQRFPRQHMISNS